MSLLDKVIGKPKDSITKVNATPVEEKKEEKPMPGTYDMRLSQFFNESGYWPYVKDLISRSIIQYQEREAVSLSARLDGKSNPNEGVFFNGKIKGAAEIGNAILFLKKNWKEVYKKDKAKGAL